MESSWGQFSSRNRATRARGVCQLAMWLLVTLLACHRSAGAQSSRDAIKQVQPKVVKIFGAGGIANLHAHGTGFLISPDGHIATVWSHVLDGDVVTVVLDDGRKFYGQVLGANPEIDLAILKIEVENLDYFEVDPRSQASPGTRVLAFSNMFKVATGDEPVSVLHGVIAARTNLTARRGRFEVPYRGPVYIVDAITNNSGAAGGVLTTYDGRLLGMIGRELRDADSNIWINYTIPTSELAPAIDDILEGRVRKNSQMKAEDADTGYTPEELGIVLVPDVVYRTPAYIDAIRAESPAASLDLRPDDLIVFVNDELVHSIRSLQEQFNRLQAEDDLTLVVRRGKQLISVRMTVPRKKQP